MPTMEYKSPPGTKSTIDAGGNANQMNQFFWNRKALVEAAKEAFFSPMADTTAMPKHFGKTIKVLHYMPLLDDRNINDQGLDAAGASYAKGNLYGSSKDIGLITSRLPILGENGGRVNRVGFTRIQREGSIQKFGLFTEWTNDSLDFDSDDELYAHISRELVTGATQLTEAVLQKDLLAGAGTIMYPGSAIADADVTAEGANATIVNYMTLARLSRTLNDNRTPKQTKVITGSRMIDTRTIASGRVMFIGSELELLVRGMLDQFSQPAFIPVHKYADAGSILNGEIGTIGEFRLVVVPEMLRWAGAGKTVVTNPGYQVTGTKYDIFPMLVVGEGAFTTVGFQSGSKMFKFQIITKMPGESTADKTDPYGEQGFSSIKWWYGTMILRPERLGLVKTVAPI
jgi:N4-gp56 family major capsid protein